MKKYNISKDFAWQGEITDKVMKVCRMFGLTVGKLNEYSISINCQLKIKDGDIVYITGPSGSGKSVLLRELEKIVPASDKINFKEIQLSNNKSVIDCIDGDLLTSLRLLSTAGLNDVFCILNKPGYLSDGQKYRFRLAAALSAGKKFIFADEFCSNLDRLSAMVVAYNIQKCAKQRGVTFFLAGAHEDILLDLAPDVLVVKELGGLTEVIYKGGKN